MAQVRGHYDADVLVGYETADDAGVYRLDDKAALVQTVDFFTPIVDDPFVYGQIAAANALSDIYAMGARPRFALSLVGFPEGEMDEDVLVRILAGGAAKLEEARVAIVGGHSIKDKEVKFGYAVTGFVDPTAILTNRGARPGDRLLLTKPLGTGIIATALKNNRCPEDVLNQAVSWMLRLNEAAAACLRHHAVTAVTDVTGYGLAGHAFEMAVAGGVCLELEAAAVPLMSGLEELAAKGHIPGGVETNRAFVGESVDWGGTSNRTRQVLLDPQTSGGLLISAAGDATDRLLEDLRKAEVFVAEIGRVVARREAYLRVV